MASGLHRLQLKVQRNLSVRNEVRDRKEALEPCTKCRYEECRSTATLCG